jgi:outer membrane protein assembly factor BamA
LRAAGIAFVLAVAASGARADSLSTTFRAGGLDPPRPVVGFVVRGKSKLRPRTLSYLAHIEDGDLVGPADLKRIQQALISSELFAQVSVSLEPAEDEDGVELVATLRDKHSWIVAPTIYVLPGKQAFGIGYAENNLRGLNQKLLLYGQLGTRDSLFFGAFLDQNVHGTDLTFRVDLYASSRVTDEYANPTTDGTSTEILRTSTIDYLGGGALVGWNFDWWAIGDLRLRGAYVRFHDSHAPDETALPDPSIDGFDVTAQARLTLDARGHYFGVTWGPYVQLFAETSIPGLDDFDYSTALLRAYYSWRLFGDHQLELRTILNVGRHIPMHEELTIGGVVDLRGYATDQFRGDTRAVYRTEYSVPFARWKSLAFRVIGFFDSGYVGYQFRAPDGRRQYLPNQHDNASWFRNDVGAGLRIYLKTIVLPLLGLDVAYGIEGHSPAVYFEVGLTDF